MQRFKYILFVEIFKQANKKGFICLHVHVLVSNLFIYFFVLWNSESVQFCFFCKTGFFCIKNNHVPAVRSSSYLSELVEIINKAWIVSRCRSGSLVLITSRWDFVWFCKPDEVCIWGCGFLSDCMWSGLNYMYFYFRECTKCKDMQTCSLVWDLLQGWLESDQDLSILVCPCAVSMNSSLP